MKVLYLQRKVCQFARVNLFNCHLSPSSSDSPVYKEWVCKSFVFPIWSLVHILCHSWIKIWCRWQNPCRHFVKEDTPSTRIFSALWLVLLSLSPPRNCRSLPFCSSTVCVPVITTTCFSCTSFSVTCQSTHVFVFSFWPQQISPLIYASVLLSFFNFCRFLVIPFFLSFLYL